jgi:glycosyltransferase involved in cell wall biosynthesis
VKVSVVVPLYHGKEYVNNILMQVNECVKYIGYENVELILYNDLPDEEIIPNVENYAYEIKSINPGFNKGIHGARVEGLKYADGEYVLFLDQDDLIKPEYFKSQLAAIGDKDASVCRVIHNKRLHYTDTFAFEKVITRDFMINNWCPIISPGQVLLRKSSIPKEWKMNVMNNNGADDYFLWLLMMGQGKRFALNDDILFEHIVNGKNTSDNNNDMMDSEDEMIEKLKKMAIYEKAELEQLRTSLRRIHIRELEKRCLAEKIINNWYKSYFRKEFVYSWIESNEKSQIAIYGAGDMGVKLYRFLKDIGIQPVCYLDQNAKYIKSDVAVYKVDSCNLKLDSILLTIPSKELKEHLLKKFDCEVIEVENI